MEFRAECKFLIFMMSNMMRKIYYVNCQNCQEVVGNELIEFKLKMTIFKLFYFLKLCLELGAEVISCK